MASSHGKAFDELYAYDRLHRLQDAVRGTLNPTRSALTTCGFAQSWTLDATGNWAGFRQAHTTCASWNLVQTRSSNPVNEITAITNTAGSTWPQPAYDPAGNMTTIPWTPPGGSRTGWAGMLAADWSHLSAEACGTLPLDHTTSQPTRSLTATYDAWNRLVSLTDSATAQLVQVNRYDARSFRIERRSYQSGALAETRHCLRASQNPLAVDNGSADGG